MKILLVNRYGFPKYGSETCFLNLCRLLKERGHEVIVFTTQDERNIDKEYRNYYVKKINLNRLNSISWLDKILSAPKTIYSLEAQKKFQRLIKDSRPDIIHLHNIKRLISGSILHSIRKSGIPVVYTLHDYQLICPNYRLFSQGNICEECKGGKFYRAVFKRCIRDSVLLSLLASFEQYLSGWLGLCKENVDIFISPSSFLRNKMIEYGMRADKITHIPNFIFTDDYYPQYVSGNYIVYCGRLAEEKGLLIILKALRKSPQIKLTVIGDGNYTEEIYRIVKKERINNIEFNGFLPAEENKKIIAKASFCIVPSVYYDISPMVIYESFAMGKPVIGADTGGIPELIEDGVNGLLFERGNAGDLAEKIEYLFNHPDIAVAMGKNARQKAVASYNGDMHYNKLIQVYQVLHRKKNQA